MGKKGDPKVPILPSTTRKGNTLNTSVALDSPSVISKLVSPPPHASHAISTESGNMSNLLMMLLLFLMKLVHLVLSLSHKLLELKSTRVLKFLLTQFVLL